MAKTLNCAFCAKQIEKKFFGGNTQTILIGTRTVDCCDECYKKYTALLKGEQKRLETKLTNYTYSTKDKLKSDETVAQMIKNYVDEKNHYLSTREDAVPTLSNVFYAFSGNKFWIEEFGLDMANSSVTNRQLLKARKQAENLKSTNTTYFTKDDITKIEYRIRSCYMLGMFGRVCVVEIRLNDQKQITYKPTIARAVFSFTKILPFGDKKKACRLAEEMLNEFKINIGSDLPIVKVKKFA